MKKALRFVVHRHCSAHPHYDFRLERGGVLRSWAVPRGLPESPGVKRLAVEVQDHPVGYIGFEGTIPEGSYGAGQVEIWDSGTYSEEGWDRDKVVVELAGGRLSGRYAVIRLMDRKWLVMKLQGHGQL